MYTNKKWIYTAITIIWVAVIFGFSMQPADVSNDLSMSFLTDVFAKLFPSILKNEAIEHFFHVLVRKGAHFSEYAVLGVLSGRAVKEYGVKHKVIWNLLFCLIIACMDETLQRFIPGREGRILDIMIDSCGAILGIAILWLIVNKIRKSEKIIKKV